MNCSRCDAKAVVRRGEAVYCGKCAMARDWEEVIQFIQTERVGMKTSAAKPADAAPAPAAADRPPAGQDEMKTRPARKPEPAAAPAADAPAPAPEPAAPPADPFA